MADNIELNLGVGGKIVATDDIGGIQHELVKVEFGTDGNATMVSTGNPLPVTDAATEVSVASIDLKTPSVGQKLMAASSPVVIASDQSAVPVSGTFFQATQPVSAVSLPLPTGAATAALQTQPGVDIGDVTVNNAAGAAAVNIQDGGNSITVDGTVAISAGSAVIGHVIADSGSTTAVTGNVTVIQGTATNLKTQAETYQGGTAVGAASPLQVSLANTGANTNKLLVTPDSVALPANQSVNVAQLAGTTTKTNSGAGGAGSLNVYIATDQPALTNALQVKSTQKPSYGATSVLAVTALQSLTSSATVGWKSVRTSNLATLATDYEIMISLTTANTAPANDKAMYLYVIPWYTSDAGSTWFAASGGTATLPTSSDAAYTIASPNNFRLLGVLNYTTAQMVCQDVFLLSNCFGNRMPDGFSFCVINFSGAALSTGCILDISPLNDILV